METIINKLPFLTPEEAQTVLERRKMDEIDRFADDTEDEEAEV